MRKVGIIGAGLAGLTAAYRVSQSGCAVDVFEARNRVGGRVFTGLIKNYSGGLSEVEIGGQNILDGGEAKNIFNLAKELGLKVKEKSLNDEFFLTRHGKNIKLSNLFAEHNKQLRDLQMLKEKAHNIGHLIEMFAGDNMVIKSALLQLMADHEGIEPYLQSVYYNFEDLYSILSDGLPQCYSSSIEDPDKVPTACFEGGNAKLPEKLAEILGGKIYLSKTLRKIITHENSATLIFEDGSSYNYDAVVLTAPASTFEYIDLTESGIPIDRLIKIESIVYGQNYKVIIPLDSTPAPNVDFICSHDSTRWYNFDNTAKIIYSCRSLVDVYSNKDLTSAPTQAVEKQYCTYDKPLEYNWNNEKFSRGSYSGYSVYISKELDDIVKVNGHEYTSLFTPVNNVLFFAGEHTTILKYIATMEAAVESGERIARAIIGREK